MLHSDTQLPSHLTEDELSSGDGTRVDISVPNGPLYALKSVLKGDEVNDDKFPMLGRRIIHDLVQWVSNNLKISGYFVYIPYC